MLLVATPPALGAVVAAAKPEAPFAREAGALCGGVFWATRVAATDLESVRMGDVAGAGTASVFDATRIAGAAAEFGTAAFCAETTPKAARPRVSNALTTMTIKRIVSLRHACPSATNGPIQVK